MRDHFYNVTIQETDLDPSKKFVMWDAPLRWYLEAHKAMFRDKGIDFGALYEQGYSLVAAEDKHSRRFPIARESSPIVVSRIDDIFEHDFNFTQGVRVDDKLAVRSQVKLVLIKDGKPVWVPHFMRTKLEK